ncbi:MAG: hypothetical protein L0332_28605 [Chloroflexi bacterium]|nr:hypothetical protein [Nitrososphaera sp.]MCI0645521.1 hypothetical protein [Chloroflexota bacterium]MCI0730660.1 hypothetical protein [Chloroflexota bacterium]
MFNRIHYLLFIIMLIFFLSLGLTNCTQGIGEEADRGTSHPAEGTVNDTWPTAMPLPPIQSLSDVTCAGTFTNEANTYPSDQLLIGKSTMSQVSELYGTPAYEGHGTYHTTWRYPDYPFEFVFEDGILVRHAAARTRLNEIIAYYGPPAEVIWQIPKIGYHGSSLYTYLIFPEQGAIFYTLRQVTRFSPQTRFEVSIIVALEDFDFHLASFRLEEDTEHNRYIHFEWPCAPDK